jgi:hypothetical protein
MRTVTRPSLLLTVAVLTWCLTASGCIPGVTWTPDSKGFYFTGGKDYNKLFYYDAATEKERVVVSDFKGTTHWPAVSPDGNRIAVAAARERGQYLQVVVYDAKGKELQQSVPWTAKGEKDAKVQFVWLFWAPKGQGDKVLVYAPAHCGIVDLKAYSFTDLGETIPWVFGGSPFWPDGKGFLTCRLGPQANQFNATFHEWSGKKTPIKLLDDPGDGKLLLFPSLYLSRWQKDGAVAGGGGLELAVDKRGATVKRVKTDPFIRNQFLFGKDSAVVTVRQSDLSREEYVVQVLAPGATEPKVVFQEAGVVMLQPSPDGQLLAVRCVVKKREGGEIVERDRLFVINAQGKVLANINTLR